jgi:UDP-glucose 4-epimerase
VNSVVFLSTDKAVYPINAMGQTKAIMEKLVLAASRTQETNTRLTITRYGNVMFSRGSVIPKFINQVMRGETMTVTDPEMTRFLMSLEESVDLVNYAMSSGAGGETFVRKAPATRMIDLAESVNRVLGGASGTALIGVRHGEKKFETLVAAEEMTRATDEGDYYRIPLDSRDLDYSSFYDAPNNALGETYDSHNADLRQGDDLDSLLLGFPQIQSAREALKNL